MTGTLLNIDIRTASGATLGEKWIADCLAFMRAKDHGQIEADLAVQDAWANHVNDIADATLYPRGNSWYVGANIPGKPRVFMLYVGGVGRYCEKCDEVAGNGYEGLRLKKQN